MSKILILFVVTFLSVCGINDKSDKETLRYGEKVSYAGGQELKFPDFNIKYVGRREAKYPDEDSPLAMSLFDFEVSKGETGRKVMWTSGTGDIAPTFFEIGGADYALELSQSDILKSLGDGNLVIWEKSAYDEAMKKKS